MRNCTRCGGAIMPAGVFHYAGSVCGCAHVERLTVPRSTDIYEADDRLKIKDDIITQLEADLKAAEAERDDALSVLKEIKDYFFFQDRCGDYSTPERVLEMLSRIDQPYQCKGCANYKAMLGDLGIFPDRPAKEGESNE